MKGRTLFVPSNIWPNDEVARWAKYANPQNERVMNRAKDSVWLDNSIPLEKRKQPKSKPRKNYNWEAL